MMLEVVTDSAATSRGIGTMQEGSLHAALKAWYAQPGDQVEVDVEGYCVDIVRGDLLIEIQTRSFSHLKQKLATLIESHPVRLVHPIAQERWIVHVADDLHSPLGRRKSPKRGSLAHVFRELVSFPQLLTHPHFSLEVLLIREEELRSTLPLRKRWRKAWSTVDRQLLDVVERLTFDTPSDFLRLLPSTLPQPFTSQDLAGALKQPRRVGQQMAYCLREMGALQMVGKRGRAFLYAATVTLQG
jgi:hypothetical protein